MKFLSSALLCLGALTVCAEAFAEADCITAYGMTACGYDCKASYGIVKCAKTPSGACEASYGMVKCWDPPVQTRQKAACIASYGDIACGYDCKASYGMVKCAKTPSGACEASYGMVKCWDPPVRTRQKAECIASYGDIACGYSCKASYGMVKCASHPDGVCRAENGRILCWEP